MNNQSSNIIRSERDEFSLKEFILRIQNFFKYMIQNWLLIFSMVLVCSSLGFYYASKQKAIYTAEYSFVLEDEKSEGLSGALGLASQFGLGGGSIGGGVFSNDNLLELMRSRTMVQKALLRPITENGMTQSLANYYIQFNGLRIAWTKQPALAKIDFPINASPDQLSRLQDSILMDIHEGLIKNFLSIAKVDKKLSIIKVKVKSINESFAIKFTEALVDQVSGFYVETKTKRSNQNVAILQHQTDSIRERLNAAISGVALANDNTPNLNAAKQILRAPSQQRQVDIQANSAILAELVKNLELAKLSLRRETPLIQVIDRPRLPLTKEKVGKIRSMIIGGSIGSLISILYLMLRKFLSRLL